MTADPAALTALLGWHDKDPAASWRDQAVCAQVDGELFFPEKGGSTRDAKKVCAGCDVKAQCLEYALAKDERHGVWGGLTTQQRRRLRRTRSTARQQAQRRTEWKWTDTAAHDTVRDLTARGWSADAIAEQLGVSGRTVYRIQARQRGVA